MSSTNELAFYTSQLAEVNRMLRTLPKQAYSTRFTLEDRKEELTEQISLWEEKLQTTAYIRLFFTGEPVLDTRAIDASFAANAIKDYQDIITKASAAKKGIIAGRGPIAESLAEGSHFNIVGIERGSFGFALEEKTQNAEIFDTSLKQVVEDVSEMLERFCAPSEEDYISFIESVDKRLFISFQKFFSLLFKSKAQIRLADRTDEKKFDAQKIAMAFSRVDGVEVKEEIIELRGSLQGLTPYSNVFDFLSENQRQITGKVSPKFSAEYKTQISQGDYFQAGRTFIAKLLEKITVRNDITKTTYTLLDLVDTAI